MKQGGNEQLGEVEQTKNCFTRFFFPSSFDGKKIKRKPHLRKIGFFRRMPVATIIFASWEPDARLFWGSCHWSDAHSQDVRDQVEQVATGDNYSVIINVRGAMMSRVNSNHLCLCWQLATWQLRNPQQQLWTRKHRAERRKFFPRFGKVAEVNWPLARKINLLPLFWRIKWRSPNSRSTTREKNPCSESFAKAIIFTQTIAWNLWPLSSSN